MFSGPAFDTAFTVCLVGNTKKRQNFFNGFSGIVDRYTEATIGAAFRSSTFRVGEQDVTLHFWDSENLRSSSVFPYSYYRGAKAILAFFKLSEPDAERTFSSFYRDLRQLGPENLTLYIAFYSEPETEATRANLAAINAAIEGDDGVKVIKPFDDNAVSNLHSRRYAVQIATELYEKERARVRDSGFFGDIVNPYKQELEEGLAAIRANMRSGEFHEAGQALVAGVQSIRDRGQDARISKAERNGLFIAYIKAGTKILQSLAGLYKDTKKAFDQSRITREEGLAFRNKYNELQGKLNEDLHSKYRLFVNDIDSWERDYCKLRNQIIGAEGRNCRETFIKFLKENRDRQSINGLVVLFYAHITKPEFLSKLNQALSNLLPNIKQSIQDYKIEATHRLFGNVEMTAEKIKWAEVLGDFAGHLLDPRGSAYSWHPLKKLWSLHFMVNQLTRANSNLAENPGKGLLKVLNACMVGLETVDSQLSDCVVSSPVRAVSPQRMPRTAPANGGAGRQEPVVARRPVVSPIVVPADRARSSLRQRPAASASSAPIEALSLSAQICRAMSPSRMREEREVAAEQQASTLRLSPVLSESYRDFLQKRRGWISKTVRFEALSEHSRNPRFARSSRLGLSHEEEVDGQRVLVIDREADLLDIRRDSICRVVSIEGGDCKQIFEDYLSSVGIIREIDLLTQDAEEKRLFRASLADFLGSEQSDLLRALEIYKQMDLYFLTNSIKYYQVEKQADLGKNPYELLKGNLKIDFRREGDAVISVTSFNLFGLKELGNDKYYPLNAAKISYQARFIRGEMPRQDFWQIETITFEGLEADVNLIESIFLGDAPADFLSASSAAHKQCVRWATLSALYNMIKEYINNNGAARFMLSDLDFTADYINLRPSIPRLPGMLENIMSKLHQYAAVFGVRQEQGDKVLYGLLMLYFYKLIANPYQEGTKKLKLNRILARLEPSLGEQLDAILVDKTAEQAKEALISKIKCLDELYRLLESPNEVDRPILASCLEAIDSSEERFWSILEGSALRQSGRAGAAAGGTGAAPVAALELGSPVAGAAGTGLALSPSP